MESMMRRLNLDAEEEEDLIVELDDVEENSTNIELCLVGRFISDPSVNFNILKSRMTTVWRPKKGVTIKEIGSGRMLFQFYHLLDLKRVVDGGPWTFGNFPLIVQRLSLGVDPLDVPLTKIPFWVRVEKVPAGLFTEKVGKMLGNFIGRFMEYDGSNKGSVWMNFMRIRVEIDVTQPLRRKKSLKLANGTSATVKFRYERLNLFCFVCGMLDHTESYCDLVFESSGEERERQWGPELKVPDGVGPDFL